MYLLDTNIVSELRRQKPHGAVLAWFNTIDDNDLFISAVTLAEIQTGIEITREQNKQRAEELENWLNAVTETYQILAMDGVVFRQWAKIMHKQSDTLYEDAMISATAQINKLVVATRNVNDFKNFDVKIFNPFDYSDNL
ncbi:MAG: type II toxin-antitoxin system VapC family toxin [Methylococcaceae bacterium]|nr:type II toxin-antitoxin system VapC family toxin [Methylococcaceae bacterium]